MTQKELILAWGKGEMGQLEQTASLSLSELVLTYRQLKAIDITSQTDNTKANLALLIRAVRQRVQQNEPLFYLACGENEYPYQESSNYGMNAINTSVLSIHVYTDEMDAQMAADETNQNTNIIGAKNGRPANDVVHVALLGERYNRGNVNHLKRMGVDTVLFDKQKDKRIDLSLRAETLTRSDNPAENSYDFFNVAPKAYAYLCITEQAENEGRPEDEIQTYRLIAFEQAAKEKIGVAISQENYEKGECIPLTIDYEGKTFVELFTDWASMVECLGDRNDIYMAIGDWEGIMSFDMPVILNREVQLDQENVKRYGTFTKNAQKALAYIASCYNLNTETKDGVERAINILNDIRAAAPVCQEFYSGLGIEVRQNKEGKSEQFAVFHFPEGELFVVNGNTAKQFFENKLCDTPAAAYHVLATLYNDKDGSAMRAFENAELYE